MSGREAKTAMVVLFVHTEDPATTDTVLPLTFFPSMEGWQA